MNPARRPAALAFAVVAAGLALPAAIGGRDAFLARFQDDAFYYFTVARHVAQGSGSTFDGLHAANGYHPLWMLLLVPVQWCTTGAWAPLVVAAGLEIVLLALAAALIAREVERVAGGPAAIAAALAPAAWPWTAAGLRCGMESALAFLACVLAWLAWNRACRAPAGGVRPWALFGAACACAFLARLEALALVAAGLMLALPAWRRRPAVAAAIAAPAAVTLLAYSLVNLALFGTALPLSGRVKAWYAAQAGLAGRLERLAGIPWPGYDLVNRLAAAGGHADTSWPLAAHLALLVSITIAAWRTRTAWRAPAAALGLPWVGLATLIWMAADTIVVSTIEPWNRAHVALAVSLALAVALASAPRVARPAAAAALALVAAASPIALWRGPATEVSYAPWRLAAAEWIAAHVPPGERVGSWNAGMIGWFSGRTVINLDGLVNDRAYFRDVIRGHHLARYLDEQGIDWLADQACGPGASAEPYLRRLGAIALLPALRTVAQFAPGPAPDRCPGTAVWRVERATGDTGPRRPG